MVATSFGRIRIPEACARYGFDAQQEETGNDIKGHTQLVFRSKKNQNLKLISLGLPFETKVIL